MLHEGVAVVPVEVRYVSRPDLVVAERFRGYRELDRNERRVAPVIKPATLLEDVVYETLPHGSRQKLVQDYPLIMPADKPLGLIEGLVGVRDALIQHPIDDCVVKLQKCQVELGDDQVLVVAGIADEGGVLAVPRKVSRRRDVYQELDAARRALLVEVRAGRASRSVEAVQRQGGDTEVAHRLGIPLAL